MIPRARGHACKGDGSIKQTPLFNRHRQSGASWAEHHGWQVPASFTAAQDEAACVRNAAGIADLSWLLKIDLKGYGLKGISAPGGGMFRWVLAPLHVLVTADPSAEKAVTESLRALSTAGSDLSLPPAVYMTDVTSVYAQFLLAGPRSRDILSKLTSLDLAERSLPDLSCAESSLAHSHAIILRKDLEGIPAYHLLVSREYGEYLWDSVLHAGQEFNLAPFGLQAQQLLKV
jgi:glycine cleavage system aminomethyltransferase T